MLPLVTCVTLTSHPKRSGMLPDAIRAFRWQTHPNKELVIINDGLPLTSKVADIRVVNLRLTEPGRTSWTIGEKRNAGVRMARGDWLATWDDDDVSLPNRLELQVKYAVDAGADLVAAKDAWIVDAQLEPKGICHRHKAVLGSALIRRQAIVAAGGYKAVSLAEDMELAERLRYVARGTVCYVDGWNFYVLRRHDNNTWQAGDELIACALHDPRVAEIRRALIALRQVPGGSDVVDA